MLQTINRYEPLLAHFADSGALHPEELFQFARRPPVSCRRSPTRQNGRRSFLAIDTTAFVSRSIR